MASTLLRMSGGLLILPLLVRVLTKEEIGLWYVLGAAGALATLVDFGLSVTTVRSVSALRAGAQKLLAHGHSVSVGSINWPAIRSFYDATIFLYKWLAVGVGVLFYGAIFLGIGSNIYELSPALLLGIILFGFSSMCIVIDANLSAFLTGLGMIRRAHQIIVAVNLLYIVAAVVCLMHYGGIFLLGGITFGCSGLRMILTWRQVSRALNGYPPSYMPEWKRSEIYLVIWPNAWRYGVVCIAAYLIVSANTLVISRNMGLVAVSSYGITNQIVNVLASFSSIFLTAKMPQIIEMGVKQQADARRKMFWQRFYAGTIIFICGGLAILFLGPEILHAIGANALLLNFQFLAFFLFYRFLEFNHSQFAGLVIAGNQMPFLWPAVVSGLLIVIGSYFLVGTYGLWGILLWTAVVQLCCNNWFPIVLGVRSLNQPGIDFK